MVEDEKGDSVHSDLSIENYDRFLLKMKPYLKNITYQKLKNSNKDNPTKGYVLADGTAIIAMWLKPSQCTNEKVYCGDFYITTDGSVKNSKYVFAFQIKQNKIVPFGTDNSTFKYYCLNGANNSRCTGWIIANGNMDYLHCDNLDYNTKTKCK